MINKTIALISEHASPLALIGGVDSGGQNIYVGELARQLAGLGYTVDVFTRRDDPRLPAEVQWLTGVRVVHIDAGPAKPLPKEELFQYMDAFTEAMETFMHMQTLTYALLHANFWMSGYVAMKLKERLSLPLVVTFHALGKVRLLHQRETDKFPAARSDVESAIMQAADTVIAECPQDLADLTELYGADARKIATIPCGFNPNEFHPIDKAYARMLLGLNHRSKVILQLGRMVPRKGIDTVIQSLALLRKRRADVRLVIVGGEYIKPELEADTEYIRLRDLAIGLGVEDAVQFEGRKDREQLKYFYSAADVFVSTPWYEPFGITPLEAMACGTPVVGAKVGGIQYSVADGRTGFLVPPKNPEALAHKLKFILDDPDLRQHMRENAIARVNKSFTWEKVARAVGEVYEMLINKVAMAMSDDRRMVEEAFHDAAMTFERAARPLADVVVAAGNILSETFAKGKKVLVCGNGGSAAEALHFSAELLGRFELPNREGLPVISLAADTAMLTAWSNDIGFSNVFARQVAAYGRPQDVLVCLSTSGNSPNILAAMDKAKQLEMKCITLLGKDGGHAREKGDVNIVIPSDNTQRIQEMHLHIIHLLCGVVERRIENRIATHLQASLMETIDKPYRQNGKKKPEHGTPKSYILG